MTFVEVDDRLLKADGDEQANDDGGDVNQEVFPCVHRRMGRMYLKRGFCRLLNSN